ncbi:tetraspanin-1 [Trichomycterus rosablanca]|uniref:tetraspanin-1 n=1 Tax=Trichomycterus rosablanca TaxID=2290929 RepID=UPI002F354C7B
MQQGRPFGMRFNNTAQEKREDKELKASSAVRIRMCTYAKAMMVLCNLLVLMAGGGLAALGIWMDRNGDAIMQVLGVFSMNAIYSIKVDYYFISVGFVMVLLGLLGLCGAKKESKCLLVTYFSVVIIIFIAVLSIGIFVMAYSSLLESTLRARGKPVLQKQFGKEYYITNMWNKTMINVSQLQCCGYNNYTDFNGSYYAQANNGSYPPSCCTNNNVNCDSANARNSTIDVRNHTTEPMVAMFMSLYLYCYLDKDAT